MPSMPSSLLLPLLALAPAALATTSAKRGIVYVAPTEASDNDYWTNSTDDMTWYYNYETTQTTAFEDSEMQFVPMQWGLPTDYKTSMSFYDDVKALQDAGVNITWTLGYNEPDGCDGGGSCISAEEAAVAWVKQFEPMRTALNITLGGPACTSADTGFTWLQEFHSACAVLHGNDTGCVMDFLPIHYYGDFSGLASHLGQVNATYTNVSSIWVTEFAYEDATLYETQDFYNESTDYFDRLTGIGKYAYFGAFRSDVSNVGYNVTFLTEDGLLTDIGSWYIGGNATGNIPEDSASTATTGSANATATYTPGTYSGSAYSSGNRASVFAGWAVCVFAATAWTLF